MVVLALALLAAACSRTGPGTAAPSSSSLVPTTEPPAPSSTTGPLATQESLVVTPDRSCGSRSPVIVLALDAPDQESGYVITYRTSGEEMATVAVPLPASIPPGDYDVSAYCDGGDVRPPVAVTPHRIGLGTTEVAATPSEPGVRIESSSAGSVRLIGKVLSAGRSPWVSFSVLTAETRRPPAVAYEIEASGFEAIDVDVEIPIPASVRDSQPQTFVNWSEAPPVERTVAVAPSTVDGAATVAVSTRPGCSTQEVITVEPADPESDLRISLELFAVPEIAGPVPIAIPQGIPAGRYVVSVDCPADRRPGDPPASATIEVAEAEGTVPSGDLEARFIDDEHLLISGTLPPGPEAMGGTSSVALTVVRSGLPWFTDTSYRLEMGPSLTPRPLKLVVAVPPGAGNRVKVRSNGNELPTSSDP